MRDRFPRLYNYCSDKEALVSDYWDEEDWNGELRRTFGEEELRGQELLHVCRTVKL